MTATTATRQERLLFVDYLRAGAILYIVGFWHLWEYAPDAPHYQNSFTHTLTFMALGLFVFISGFLLARDCAGFVVDPEVLRQNAGLRFEALKI